LDDDSPEMRAKQYLPLVILLGLVALYAQFSSVTAKAGQTGPPTTLATPAQIAAEPDDKLSSLQLVLPEGVEVIDQTDSSALLRIDMKGHQRLLVTAQFDSPSKEWSLNLGDSISNNGWGGDGSTNHHDAEVQILDGRFEIYASDAVGSQPPYDEGKRFLRSWPEVATGPGTVQFEVADGEVALYAKDGQIEAFRHDALFALKGQPDSEAGVNYDLYLGVNRVVSQGRTGTGISKLELSFR
jgi:hypothetical protein